MVLDLVAGSFVEVMYTCTKQQRAVAPPRKNEDVRRGTEPLAGIVSSMWRGRRTETTAADGARASSGAAAASVAGLLGPGARRCP